MNILTMSCSFSVNYRFTKITKRKENPFKPGKHKLTQLQNIFLPILDVKNILLLQFLMGLMVLMDLLVNI